MSKQAKSGRRPAALRADDPGVFVAEAGPMEPMPPAEDAAPPSLPAKVSAGALRRGLRWGSILFSSLGGLAVLGLGIWLAGLVEGLLARSDWIGWAAIVLLALVGLAATMMALREGVALMRLARLGRTRRDADSALRQDDKALAEGAAKAVERLYSGRAELSWGRARLREHEGDILDARERLILAERELLAPLDGEAKALIASSAKRVSVMTAVSPAALVDMILVAAENLRLLRRIAANYGARPGFFGLARLSRMVLTHIVLTGGIAIGDDLIQQMIGHRLTAKLSARLGEGVFNGALTARIGLAAIDVCRPLPFLETRRPRLRDLVSMLTGFSGGGGKG